MDIGLASCQSQYPAGPEAGGWGWGRVLCCVHSSTYGALESTVHMYLYYYQQPEPGHLMALSMLAQG